MTRLPVIAALLALSLLAGCDSHLLRREFYRGEIKYLHTQGARKYQTGDYLAAGRIYQRILALDPKDTPARIQLAHLALAQGQAQKAAKLYRAILLDAPERMTELEPYFAYAITMPQKPGTPDTATSIPGGNGMERREGDAARPDHSLGGLQHLLVGMLKSGTGSKPLRRFVLGLDDPAAWIRRQQLVTGPAQRTVSRDLLKLYDKGRISYCDPCLEFAALWFGARAEGRQLALMAEALERPSLAPGVHREIAYSLGLAYERSGRHTAAVRLYLANQDDKRMRERLRRLAHRKMPP